MIIPNTDQFEKEGRIWLRNRLSETELLKLEKHSPLNEGPGFRLNGSENFLKLMASFTDVKSHIGEFLPNPNIVRAVLFNKSVNVNWGVPWHQDRIIAVKEKRETLGYNLWTKKSGVWHVEPPVEILAGMVFIHIHFDDSNVDNGCLELALGSHKFGRIKRQEMSEILSNSKTELCTAKRGDILIVKALTLHRSLKSKTISYRRNLRIDYSNQELPKPLQWKFSL